MSRIITVPTKPCPQCKRDLSFWVRLCPYCMDWLGEME